MRISNFNPCSQKKGFHNFVRQLFPFIIWDEFSENALKYKTYNEQFLTDVLNSKDILETVKLFQDYKIRTDVPDSFKNCFSRIIPDNVAFNLQDYDQTLCESYAGLVTYYLYMIELNDFYNPQKDFFLQINSKEDLFWKDFVNYLPLTGKNKELIYYDPNHNIFRCDVLGHPEENDDSKEGNSISLDDKFYYHHPTSIPDALRLFLHVKYLYTSFYLEKDNKKISLLNAFKEGSIIFNNMPSPEVIWNKKKEMKKTDKSTESKESYEFKTISSLEGKYDINEYYDIDDVNQKISLKPEFENASCKFISNEETDVFKRQTRWEKYAIKNISSYSSTDINVLNKARTRYYKKEVSVQDAENYISVLKTTIEYHLEACTYGTCNQYSSLYEVIKNIVIEWHDKKREIEHKLGIHPFSYKECEFIANLYERLKFPDKKMSVFQKLNYICEHTSSITSDESKEITRLLEISQGSITFDSLENKENEKDWTLKHLDGNLKSSFVQRIYNVISEEFMQESEFITVLPEYLDEVINDLDFLKEVLAYQEMGRTHSYSCTICKRSKLFLLYEKFFKKIEIKDKKMFTKRMADALSLL